MAAVGLEALKQGEVVYLDSVTTSPAGVAFGAILGLLVFANLSARFILFVTAWTPSAAMSQCRTTTAAPAQPSDQ